jgi:hypothetical protein
MYGALIFFIIGVASALCNYNQWYYRHSAIKDSIELKKLERSDRVEVPFEENNRFTFDLMRFVPNTLENKSLYSRLYITVGHLLFLFDDYRMKEYKEGFDKNFPTSQRLTKFGPNFNYLISDSNIADSCKKDSLLSFSLDVFHESFVHNRYEVRIHYYIKKEILQKETLMFFVYNHSKKIIESNPWSLPIIWDKKKAFEEKSLIEMLKDEEDINIYPKGDLILNEEKNNEFRFGILSENQNVTLDFYVWKPIWLKAFEMGLKIYLENSLCSNLLADIPDDLLDTRKKYVEKSGKIVVDYIHWDKTNLYSSLRKTTYFSKHQSGGLYHYEVSFNTKGFNGMNSLKFEFYQRNGIVAKYFHDTRIFYSRKFMIRNLENVVDFLDDEDEVVEPRKKSSKSNIQTIPLSMDKNCLFHFYKVI